MWWHIQQWRQIGKLGFLLSGELLTLGKEVEVWGLPWRLLIQAAGLVAVLLGVWAGIHYYNLHQQELGAAATEVKYAKLRQKGAEIVQQAAQRGLDYQNELAKQSANQLRETKKQLLLSESARATQFRVFQETSAAAKQWAAEPVPSFVVEQLRMHQLAVAERATSSSSSSVISSSVSK
jgi:hypothetical protein